MKHVSDVIALWPSPQQFAADVGVELRLVNVWRHRRSIPAERWAAVEAAALRRGIVGASASEIAKLAAQARTDSSAPTAGKAA